MFITIKIIIIIRICSLTKVRNVSEFVYLNSATLRTFSSNQSPKCFGVCGSDLLRNVSDQVGVQSPKCFGLGLRHLSKCATLRSLSCSAMLRMRLGFRLRNVAESRLGRLTPECATLRSRGRTQFAPRVSRRGETKFPPRVSRRNQTAHRCAV